MNLPRYPIPAEEWENDALALPSLHAFRKYDWPAFVAHALIGRTVDQERWQEKLTKATLIEHG